MKPPNVVCTSREPIAVHVKQDYQFVVFGELKYLLLRILFNTKPTTFYCSQLLNIFYISSEFPSLTVIITGNGNHRLKKVKVRITGELFTWTSYGFY